MSLARALSMLARARDARVGACGGHADRRHDRRRSAGHHRQPRPGFRRLSLCRLQPLRFAGAVGSVEAATRPPTSSPGSPPPGISTKATTSAGSSSCARASNGMTAAISPPMTCCGTCATRPTRRRRNSTPRNSPRRGPISAPMPASRRSTTTPSPLTPRCRIRCSPTRSAMC